MSKIHLKNNSWISLRRNVLVIYRMNLNNNNNVIVNALLHKNGSSPTEETEPKNYSRLYDYYNKAARSSSGGETTESLAEGTSNYIQNPQSF